MQAHASGGGVSGGMRAGTHAQGGMVGSPRRATTTRVISGPQAV